MVEPLAKLKASLRENGQKLTRSRQLVFEALQDKEPQTIKEIYDYCAGLSDRSSIYRTIALYEQIGIIKRLQIGWKYKLELSDDFHHHHHHMTCLNCGRTIALPEDSPLENRLEYLAAKSDFKIQDHQIEIQGYCSNCG